MRCEHDNFKWLTDLLPFAIAAVCIAIEGASATATRMQMMKEFRYENEEKMISFDVAQGVRLLSSVTHTHTFNAQSHPFITATYFGLREETVDCRAVDFVAHMTHGTIFHFKKKIKMKMSSCRR